VARARRWRGTQRLDRGGRERLDRSGRERQRLGRAQTRLDRFWRGLDGLRQGRDAADEASERGRGEGESLGRGGRENSVAFYRGREGEERAPGRGRVAAAP
jgi:hypothetical protein